MLCKNLVTTTKLTTRRERMETGNLLSEYEKRKTLAFIPSKHIIRSNNHTDYGE